MNKEFDKKRIGLVLLCIAIVGILSAIFFGRLLGVFQAVMNRYSYSYRYIIAHFLAIVTVGGLMVLLLRKIPFINEWKPLERLRGKSQETESTPPAPLKENNHHKTLLIAGLIVVLLFWSHYLFIGQDTHVKIFDNLDSHVPQTKILADSGKALSLNPNTKLDNLLNGVYLSGVDSGYNVMTWLFMIFPPFVAYAINELLMRIVAYLGMVLLLSSHIFTGQDKERYYWIIIGSALCFSLLPFYPAGGLSIAGIPLLLNAFLNIREGRKRVSDFLIIFIFPFYSKLALAGVFIAISLFLIFLIDLFKKKTFNTAYFGGLALLTITYMFSHFHLVYSFLAPGFVSSREEIKIIGTPTGRAISNTIWNFLFDRINVVGAQQLFVIGSAALAIWVGVVKRINTRLMNTLVILCMATAAMWGFKYWEPLMPVREKFQLLNAFDFSRFYWLNPFMWYLIFALALFIIAKLKKGKIIVAVLIIGQVLFMFVHYNWEYRYRLGLKSSYAGNILGYSLTYREFFSEKLFDEIEEYIGKPKKDYRVVSLGLLPGISQYNGFYTLDIYTDVYPLEYKHRFREVFVKEIEKSPIVKRRFDENGKRCFLMAAELHGKRKLPDGLFNRGIVKSQKKIRLKNLEINTSAFKEMGGQYIFSAVEILNATQNNLNLEKIFQRKDSPWRIYLYRAL